MHGIVFTHFKQYSLSHNVLCLTHVGSIVVLIIMMLNMDVEIVIPVFKRI